MNAISTNANDIIYPIASFLQPRDLLRLALTSQQFGGKCDVGSSAMEEVARNRVEAALSGGEWNDGDLLRRRGDESWMAVDYRLHLLRTSSVFHRLVGSGIAYAKNGADPSDVRPAAGTTPPAGARQRRLECSLAICQEVMTSGRHYVEFTVVRAGSFEPGIVRPCRGWDATGLGSDKRSIFQHYQDFCEGERLRGVPGYKHHHSHFIQEMEPQVYENTKLGLLLDLDRGTLTKYQDGEIKHERGLCAGHYCWALSVASHSASVKINRLPVPDDLPQRELDDVDQALISYYLTSGVGVGFS